MELYLEITLKKKQIAFKNVGNQDQFACIRCTQGWQGDQWLVLSPWQPIDWVIMVTLNVIGEDIDGDSLLPAYISLMFDELITQILTKLSIDFHGISLFHLVTNFAHVMTICELIESF